MAFNPDQERNRHFCAHCNRYLSKTLFFRHKQLYYDTTARTWSSERVIHPVVAEDKEFSCDIDTSSHDDDMQADLFVIPQAELTDSSDLHDTVQAPDSIPGPEDHDSEVLVYFS